MLPPHTRLAAFRAALWARGLLDGLATDPLTSLALTPAAIRQVAERVVALAEELADGRLIVLGGGGYGPDSAAAWAEVVQVLLGGEDGR